MLCCGWAPCVARVQATMCWLCGTIMLTHPFSLAATLYTSWWRYQIEASSALLPFCAGNSPVTGHWREALMFSLICAWTNSWGNNEDLIWDAIALIMTSLKCSHDGWHSDLTSAPDLIAITSHNHQPLSTRGNLTWYHKFLHVVRVSIWTYLNYQNT